MKKNYTLYIILTLLFLLIGGYFLYYSQKRYVIPNDQYVISHFSVTPSLREFTDYFNRIDRELNHLKTSSLLMIEDHKISVNSFDHIQSYEIDDESYVEIFGAWFQLKRSLLHQIILKSQGITLYLQKAKPNEIHAITQLQQQQKEDIINETNKIRASLEKTGFIQDYYGFPAYLHDHISLKIPIANSPYKLEEHVASDFKIAGVPIDMSQPHTKSYRLKPLDRTNYRLNSGYIAILPASEPVIDLTNIAPHHQILYQEENGIIFRDRDHIFTAIFATYNEKTNIATISEYKSYQKNIPHLRHIYNIFRTIDESKKGEIATYELFTLPSDELEAKLNMTIEDQFYNIHFLDQFKKAMDTIVNSPLRYTTIYTDNGKEAQAGADDNTGYPIRDIDPVNDDLNAALTPKQAFIHYDTMQNVLKNFQARDPQGTNYGNLFVWSSPTYDKHLSFLIEDNDITFEIRIGQSYMLYQPNSTLALLLSTLFKKHSPLNIHKNADLTNAGIYHKSPITLPQNFSIFIVKEGIINHKGELISKVPPEEIHKIDTINDQYIHINHRYLYNQDGEILLDNIRFAPIDEDLFLIEDPGHPDDQRQYDANQKVWLESEMSSK